MAVDDHQQAGPGTAGTWTEGMKSDPGVSASDGIRLHCQSGGRKRCQLEGGSMPSLDAVRARFERNEGLPFADVLTEDSIRDVLNEQGVQF